MLTVIIGIFEEGFAYAILALGVYITYKILDFPDLSVDGTFPLGGAVTVVLILAGVNPVLTLLLTFLTGAIAGIITGIIHVKFKVRDLLSGIIVMTALYSINLRILGKANVSLLRMDTVYTIFLKMSFLNNNLFVKLGITHLMPVIVLGIIVVLGIITILYWFFGTEIGCSIRATGDNPQMSRAQGINTNNMIVIGLIISNGLVAVSGALIAQQQSFADIQMGTGSIVIGLASAIIGEVLFSKRSFFSRLVSLVFGAITYRVIIALVLKMGMPANDLKLFTAITVAVALALPEFSSYLCPITKSIRGGASGAIRKQSL